LHGLTAANAFVEEAVRVLSPDLRSIILAGSYARGEAREESDLDLWCVFSALEPRHLQAIGQVVLKVGETHRLEINPQCVTESEFRRFRSFGTVLAVLEGRPLFGNMAAGTPPTNEVLSACESLLGEAILSCRHYICVAEPWEKLAGGKLRRWVLKPLSFGLRLERYLSTGAFPITAQDLLQVLKGQRAEQAMTWLTKPQVLWADLEQSAISVLDTVLKVADEALVRVHTTR
jgi:predicted nucleotidyltransferase